MIWATILLMVHAVLRCDSQCAKKKKLKKFGSDLGADFLVRKTRSVTDARENG